MKAAWVRISISMTFFSFRVWANVAGRLVDYVIRPPNYCRTMICVCSQVLKPPMNGFSKPAIFSKCHRALRKKASRWGLTDRQSVGEGTSVSVRVDIGGRRVIKKKKNKK